MTVPSLLSLAGIGLFCTGVYLVLTRRNAVMALMGIELMLNAANLNFIAFSRRDLPDAEGQIVSIFVMALAAAETAVALALILNLFKRQGSAELDTASRLRN
ncbi:MAG: NADH-quinone oxidoreductase subunit NuoK [Bacteroidia bacterium]|nr:NADH-quinone oxidoreductase subunit NuoK [Bacteroidia bacterium]